MTTNAGGKTGEQVREMFAAVAPRYDLLNAILSLGRDAYWRRRAAAECAGAPEGPFVDVCCGTGELLFAIARAAGGARLGVGVDFCGPMLKLGAARAARRAPGARVLFVRGDATRIPLADGSSALTTVAFGLRNVADVDACLREMARVTAPGGKVAILEFSRPRGFFFGRVYGLYFRFVLPAVGRIVSGVRGDAYSYLPRSVDAFPSPEELARRMREAGLADVSARPLTRGVVHLYIGRKG